MGTIAITGAASGIGAALAARLGREGHEVIGIDVQPGDIVADLGDPEGRAHAARAVAERCGARLDGLVSGAALGPYCEPAPVLRVNYFGALQILDDLLPLLAEGREPAAVAISSIGAIYADVLPEQAVPDALDACLAGDEEKAIAAIAGRDGNAAYCVAKRGLALKVREYATAWGAAGVRLNAICPGRIATPDARRHLRHPGNGRRREGDADPARPECATRGDGQRHRIPLGRGRTLRPRRRPSTRTVEATAWCGRAHSRRSRGAPPAGRSGGAGGPTPNYRREPRAGAAASSRSRGARRDGRGREARRRRGRASSRGRRPRPPRDRQSDPAR